MLSAVEKKILNFVQGDLPLNSAPYAKLAEKLKITEDRIVRIIASLKAKGYIRRFGAFLKHNQVGLKANCMCAWNVPKDTIEKIGRICAKEQSISHCYERKSKTNWPYNFYTMVHAKTKAECRSLINSIAKRCKVDD